ncbi:MAG: PAS domain-containing protein [Chromatiales bacterium]|nr:PAS domain-containing protein [Chromatiales bacterium]
MESSSLVTDLERHLAASEREIQQLRRRFGEIETMASLGSWELDLVSSRLYWSRTIFELFELDPVSVVPSYETFLTAIHPDDRATVDQAYTRSVRERRPYDIVHRLLMRDQRIKWVHERGNTEYDAKGMPLRSLGTVQDVTDLVQAERDKRESERRFRDIISAIGDWVWEIDLNGRYHYASPTVRQLLGYESEEMLGRSVFEFMPTPDAAQFSERFAEVIAKGMPFRDLVYRRKHRDGTLHHIQTSGVPVFDTNRELIAYRGVDKDITAMMEADTELRRHRDHLQEEVDQQTEDLREAKEAAEAANRAKSEFLANMSHELRTPMHAIMGFAELGVENVEQVDRGKLRQYFERIHSSSLRLLDLLNDLLDLSKLEAGKMEFKPRRSDLNRVANLAVAEMAELIRRKNLSVEVVKSKLDTHAIFDPEKLLQVVRNLLANAIKFSQPGEHISLRFAASELADLDAMGQSRSLAALSLQVEDRGPGIPDRELNTIFDKFVQSSATRTGAGGTGLGLAICREIVRGHKGCIEARNRPEGGAIFTVSLPRKPR